MLLSPGTRLGPYEIQSALGAGGMGEVYRARDTRLKRDVALKILPEAFATDPDRLARFRREAQVLASLNHPNIAAIHGLEESDGIQALVLELVDGPTLADRIAQGAIPVDEALPIAKQIAEALQAAHEQGIIHRDLKPANIKLRPDGTVKVLDFGLAKALEPAGPASDASQSPTITSPAMMTGAGVILGTAAYMSPEQARGKQADRRSDVWAFGCVLYEMLSGKRVFEGDDVSDTLANVLKMAPDWTALPGTVPAPLRSLLTLCLERDRAQRLANVAVVQFLLSERATVPDAQATTPTTARATAWRRMLPWGVAGALAVAFLATVALWAPWQEATPLQPVRFTIAPPTAQPFYLQGFYRNLAISPDGTHLVYVAGSGDSSESQLMVHTIDRLDAVPLRGITGAAFPFISPDGRWVGFFEVGTGELKKVSIAGGSPITLCRFQGNARGASWGPDDTIVFATNDRTTGLLSVPAGGGEPTVLTKPDAARGEQDHLFPSLLPGGRAALFTMSAGTGVDNSHVAVLDLKTGQRKTLVRGGTDAEYVDTGHLVYVSAGTLRAVRFDPNRLEVLSDPAPIVEQVATLTSGASDFRVSRQGTLVYVSGRSAAQGGAARSLVWVTRQGRETPINAPTRDYVAARVSPDSTRVTLNIRREEDGDIWIWELGRQTLTRLTFGPGRDSGGIWSPDGRRIVFNSTRTAPSSLFWQAADGTGAVERLTTDQDNGASNSFSPDGKSLVLRATNKLMLLRLDGTPRAEPLLQTSFDMGNGEISPNGRWLAYYSNESGRFEVYVRPFPKVDGGRWQISTGGGTRPAWSRTGSELFYLDPTTAMMAVPVQTTPTFSAGNPSKLFDGPWYVGLGGTRSYDVSSDGRFLMIKDAATGSGPSASPTITVVLNWTEELKRLVPVN